MSSYIFLVHFKTWNVSVFDLLPGTYLLSSNACPPVQRAFGRCGIGLWHRSQVTDLPYVLLL